MTFSGHYEFLAPRGAGKSAYRDALCGVINKNSCIKALGSRRAAFSSLGRKFLPPFAANSAAFSCRFGRIVSKTFLKRSVFETEAYEMFLGEYQKTAGMLKLLPPGTDTFMHWFKIVSGRYQLSKKYLKSDEMICYGGGFVFCLEHLFGRTDDLYIEEFLSLLPKPRLLIEIKTEEKSLLAARQQRGDGGPLRKKVREEMINTEKLSGMARRQGIKSVSFFNYYSGVKFPEETAGKIMNSLPDSDK